MKKSTSRLLSSLLALCMVLVLLPGTAWAATASGKCGANLTWSYSNGTLTVQGTGKMEDYELNTGTPWLRYNNSIRTVNIGDGVASIGSFAFFYCRALTSVTVPNSLTSIGATAFCDCGNLTNITFPDSVTSIGSCAFMNCTSLTTFIIPKGVTSIGYQTFDNCSSLTSIIIPSGVTTIGRGAFHGCSSLTDVYYGGSESQWKQVSIDSSAYSTGAYTDKNGNAPLFNATIHYNSTGSSTPGFKIELSAQNLTVDDKENIACEKYNIDGRNYFKLRDLAALLNGTGSQFEVGYDDASKTISITTGEAYTPNGSELVLRGDMSSKAEVSAQALRIDGEKHDGLKVYNIGGNNFFQLRELGDLLGFEVGYDDATKTAIVNSK